MANPSLGHGFLTERALASAAATDDEAVFRTECLCQEVRAVVRRPFPEGAWEAGLDPESSIPEGAPLFFGLDMSADRKSATLAVCGARPDGCWHVEVIARQGGHAWAVEALRRLAGGGEATVAIQGRGATVSSYADEIAAAEGVSLVTCEGKDLSAWCGRFYDAVCAASGDAEDGVAPVYHLAQPVLDEAASLAQKRDLGDGAWAWDRRSSSCDIAPLVACTMAFGLATRGERAPRQSAYQDHDLVFI